MASDRVITAPLAIIRVGSVPIGKMRGIKVQESIQRGRVQGLGKLTPDELPALSWSGTLSCDFYNIDFNKSQIPNAIIRDVNLLKDWVSSVILQEDGVQVDLYRLVKTPPGAPGFGLIQGTEKLYATIKGLFLDAEGFDLSEGQVSGRNQSFQYLFPIIYPV